MFLHSLEKEGETEGNKEKEREGGRDREKERRSLSKGGLLPEIKLIPLYRLIIINL